MAEIGAVDGLTRVIVSAHHLDRLTCLRVAELDSGPNSERTQGGEALRPAGEHLAVPIEVFELRRVQPDSGDARGKCVTKEKNRKAPVD